ncbi:hypothetical protein [Actinomadura roseirufa]|uniref:hypothetical protein n=1 Tax=Actinomadura roseirufa TaxID=2094049 RepID=UPI0010416DD7|nr:hypothetical protein [Actinomadura roseirufa]
MPTTAWLVRNKIGCADGSYSPARHSAPKDPRSVRASRKGRLDVEKVQEESGLYFLVHPRTRDICGTMLDQGDGWWRCRTPRGKLREIYVPAGVDEPWRYVAERVSAA